MKSVFKSSYLFSLLVLVKVILYYWMMDINFSTVWMVTFTASTIYLFYLGLNQSTIRKTLFLIIYFAISALMFGEVIYYRYFNTNLSFVIIQQAPKLYDVSDSVKGLVEIKEFLLLLDLPIVTYFIVNGKHPKMKHHRMLFPLLIIVILCVALNPLHWDAFTVLNHQEMFTFHVADLIRTPEDVGLPEEYEGDVEESSYVEDPQYFGLFEDRKVVVVQLESIQNFLIDLEYDHQEIMPYLTSLTKKDSIYFNSYYQQLGRGNTSDAEFVSNNSLYAAIHGVAYELYEQDYFRGLPWILREHGYSTAAYHGYLKSFWNRENAYPSQGFQSYTGGMDFKQDEIIGMGLADKSFFRQSVPYIVNATPSSYHFLISLTSHNPYLMDEGLSEINLRQEHEDTLVGNYLRSANYVDHSLEAFINEIDEHDDISNYLFVFYGDHFGVNCKDEEVHPIVSSLIGESYEYQHMLNIPLIMYAPGSGIHEEVNRVGGQIDFQPTMLNLLGIKDEGIKFGQDILNSNRGFVASQTYMSRGSFITDEILFEMSRDGIFEHSVAYNRLTGEPIPLDVCFEDYIRALKEIQASMKILEHDGLKALNSQLELKRENMLVINDISRNEQLSYYNQFIADFSELRLQPKGELLLKDKEKHQYFIKTSSPALLNAWMKSVGIDHSLVIPVIENSNQISQYRYYGYQRPMLDVAKKSINVDLLKEVLRQEALTGIVVAPDQLEVVEGLTYNVPIFVMGVPLEKYGSIYDINQMNLCK